MSDLDFAESCRHFWEIEHECSLSFCEHNSRWILLWDGRKYGE